MVLVVLSVVGSILFGIERYNYWKVGTNNRAKLLAKCFFAGLGLFLGLCLIIFIASTYWW